MLEAASIFCQLPELVKAVRLNQEKPETAGQAGAEPGSMYSLIR